MNRDEWKKRQCTQWEEEEASCQLPVSSTATMQNKKRSREGVEEDHWDKEEKPDERER